MCWGVQQPCMLCMGVAACVTLTVRLFSLLVILSHVRTSKLCLTRDAGLCLRCPAKVGKCRNAVDNFVFRSLLPPQALANLLLPDSQ